MSRKTLFIILCLLSFLPLISLWHSGIPATHDGPDHVARIANFYQSLSEGNLVPRWAPYLNWGYGHPILMFLYPLPSYLASLFHATGFNFVDSTKLVFGVSYILGILIFFLWASEQWNPVAGFVGALIYGFSPYRFVDFYVRGDIGEHTAFIFPPLVFWGLLRLAKGKGKYGWFIVSLGTFGLITAHNAIAIMALPLVGLYTLYLGYYKAGVRRNFFISAVALVLMGFVLSAFFWIPAFFEGKYTLRDILTRGEFSQRFVNIGQFFYTSWNYGGGNDFSKEFGIITWAALIGALILLFKTKKQETRIFIIGSLAIIFISVYIMTRLSLPFWNTVSLLQKFQFPWRFLAVEVIVGAALGSAVVYEIKKRYAVVILVVTGLVAIFSTYFMWRPHGYVDQAQSYYSGIYNSTTDTGESSPVWSVRFMEQQVAASMQIIDGSAQIKQLSRNSTRHVYDIDVKEKARLVENTLYFPGWKIVVDGNEVPIEFQDPSNRGLMTFWLDPGKHTVVVEFTETKLRKLSDYISVLGWTMTIVLLGITLWKKK